MKRLLIFGDSILRGVYFSEEAGRHKLFGDRFSELKARGWEVKNCSIMGATVTTGEELLPKRLPEAQDDTTVLFEYGGNDCDYRWKDISDNPSGKFSPNTPADRFVKEYGACIDYAKRQGARVFLCNLLPLDATRYVDWVSRNLSKENILKWLGSPEALIRTQEEYSLSAEQIAEDTESRIIDIRTPFRTPALLSPDGIHPTAEGHRFLDSIITEAILS